MSTFYSNGTTAPDAPQRPRKKRRIAYALFFTGGLLLGGTVMGAGKSAPAEPAAAPTPAPTVTETVEVKVPGPVETKTVEVPGPATVPPTCTTALDYADEGFTLARDIMQGLQDGLQTGDFTASEAKTNELTALAPKYNATKEACRLAAEK